MTTVVLVEGVSDVAAVRAIGVTAMIIPMGGATNVRRFVDELEPSGVRLIGLCDRNEQRFFSAVLDEFYVCNADLEDELIRCLGTDRVEQLIAEQGDMPALRTFQNQPAQRQRSTHDQLHRFMGTLSGRKERYGAVLASALVELPEPLSGLVATTTPSATHPRSPTRRNRPPR